MIPHVIFVEEDLPLQIGERDLIVVAPELAAGAYPSPRVVGVTHLFTLGWITTSIMGALYQFLPVALGEPIRSVPAAHLSFALYVPGFAVFVTGLLIGRDSPMTLGAVMLGLGVLLFATNLGATLWRSTRRDVTWWALACADLFLIVTLTLGLALAGNLRWGYLGAARLTAIGTHLHVALGGWVLLVMVGVAHRLLPMFLLSHGAGDRYARAAVALLGAGAGVLAIGHHGPPIVSRWLPAALLGAGLVAFLLQARSFYRHRHRPALDPGMRLAAGALGLLAIGLVLAGPAMLAGGPARLATAYVLVMVLGISLFVAAHYYKIIPFLVWYHRFGPLVGKRPVPSVGQLYSARRAAAAGALLVLGTLTIAAATMLSAPRPARAGAVLLAAGVVIEAGQMLGLARRTP